MIHSASWAGHLLVELDGPVKITDTKHDLAQGFRCGSSLDDLKQVAVRILNKGNYAGAPFDWTRFTRYFAALLPDVLDELVNLEPKARLMMKCQRPIQTQVK